MQPINGMKGIRKNYFSIVLAFCLTFGGVSVGLTTTSSYWEKNQNLTSILKNDIFSAFSIDTSYYDVGLMGMCDGEILDSCVVTSEYGLRNHPIRKRSHFHTGIDLSAPRGSLIHAPADGVVKLEGRGRGYGRMVELEHGYAWSTRYAHMKKIYVKKDQHVKKGDIIGEVGSSGSSTGPHLHFEMIYFGSHVNPKNYIASLNYVDSPPFAFANR